MNAVPRPCRSSLPRTRRTALSLACAYPLTALLLGAPLAQWASAATTDGLEEVIVTSRKQAEDIQVTPVAVSAFSTNSLEQRGVANLTQLGGVVPNLTMEAGAANGGGSNSSTIYIRGVGQTDFLATTDPGVGIYIDGIYYPRSVGSVMDLLDLERVEVLRGPQGTLFGKNTIGGAINMVSTKPSSKAGGYGELTIGSYNRVNFKGSVDQPLIENSLNSRFAIVSKKADGYADVRSYDFATAKAGPVIDERGNENKLGLRASFNWFAIEDLTAELVLDYTHSREKPGPVVLLDYTGGPQPTPALGSLWNNLVGFPNGTPMSTALIANDKDTTYGNANAVNDLDQWGVGLTVDRSFDAFQLKSITGYRGFQAEFGRDGDGSPLDWQQTIDDQSQYQFSQEFQLNGKSFDNRLNWTTGLFYFKEQNIDRNHIQVLPGLYTALEALPGQLSGSPCAAPWVAPGCAGNPINLNLDLDLGAYNKIISDSYAAFGQVNFDVTDAFRLTAGLRYSYETKEYTHSGDRKVSNTISFPLASAEESWGAVSPMAGADYKINENFMLYTSASKGFKSGGFNGRPLTVAGAKPFDPEFVTSYEAGFKSEWFDNRVRLNAAAFLSHYSDMQFTANVYSNETQTFEQIIDNVGKAKIHGFEIELEARPIPALSIQSSVGHTQFRITDLTADVPGVTEQSQQPHTPEWTASTGITYTWNLANGDLSLRGDWIYEGKSFIDIQNTPTLEKEISNRYNARLSYSMQESGWDFALYGTNLSNQRYIVSGLSTLDSFGHVEGSYSRPREYGATVRKSF
jgi:iron complex outermembrane recepter protein